MEKHNISLSDKSIVNDTSVNNIGVIEAPMLHKVRNNFRFLGGISLIFGLAFAILFYKAGLGLNGFIFSVVMVSLLTIVSNYLEVPLKKTTVACFAGAVLLGLSSALTSNEALQFLNTVGTILLLNLSLLYQYQRENSWSFLTHLGRMFGLIFKVVGSIGMPFIDCNRYLKSTRVLKNDKLRNTLIGIIISLPILLVVSTLLASADQLFGSITKQLNRFLFSTDVYLILILILFGFFSCYCILCGALTGSNNGKEAEENLIIKSKADPGIAITVILLLNILYAIFCGIQIMYLFANRLFQLPNGYTFSEYARRGFFELLFVTVINITLMLVCSHAVKESKVLNRLMLCMTIGTYILIASAGYRMLLYIGAYGLTFLRLLVLLFLLMDSFILGGVLYSVYQRKFPLFGYTVTVISICYLLFSFSRPDYFIASNLIHNKETLSMEDVDLLTRELSLDAAPVVVPVLSDPEMQLPKEELGNTYQMEGYYYSDSYRARYYRRIDNAVANRDLRDFNLSRTTAKQLINKIPLE